MATYYRWRKSAVQYSSVSGGSIFGKQITFPVESYIDGLPAYYVLRSQPSISPNGTFDFSSAPFSTTIGYGIAADGGYYAASKAPKTYYYVFSLSMDLNCNGSSFLLTNADGNIQNIQSNPGSFQEYVYSTSSSAYPNGGVQDGYYYDQRTTVTSPTAPTGLTYPNPITTPSVSVSWTAATSATNYPVSLYEVSYSTNGGSSWTVAGTTAEVSYTFSITPGTTSIMFRVRAQDSNGQWGGYVTGTASQVLLAPTLTVPQMVMQGQQATISWSAIEGADSYTLQRKSSADADWTQVYSGANLSYSETVGTWTSLQYRVQAVFSGSPGGWATSDPIQIVSASALVISGTDGDLGTVVNDIPYSISTDTGNQITATITVNSAVIFSGNVGNSTADVIPVLDLVNGTGTIVIEASVTASSGPVSAVRTWTYTKAPITFPNAGSVAQLTQEGENIFPKTLAECVRLPGGKTLDQVTGFPAQVYTGSYVGTGTSGSSNPNTLTFPFKPQMVFVSSSQRSYSTAPMLRNSSRSSTGTASSNLDITVQWTDNGVSWYASTIDHQLNYSGTTYYYIALG